MAGTGKAEWRLYTAGIFSRLAAIRPDRQPWVWTRSGFSYFISVWSRFTSSLW